MATVFVPPSPQTSMTMATRRPLANVPNATNSPHRAGLLPAKRSRSTQMEIPYGQPPPKKQVMEGMDYEAGRSATTNTQNTDSKLFARRSNNAVPSAFEKKLVAAREKERQPAAKPVKVENMDSIRQWQRHYRKAFPSFVFYFDSMPEEMRRKCSRQVIALGAREEKFFSRLVTHVVTSRAIPPEPLATDSTNGESNVQTVNPSLLERNGELHLHTLKTDTRREQATKDTLQRARQMGMKIWALEKLQRMITTINDSDIGGQYDNASRNKGTTAGQGKGDNDLSRVLRQELLNGPSDRDPLASMEMLTFKGPVIYIHDMNEKTKPVLVREYARVARRQDGAWPQFRSAPLGKCPFVDEPPSRKEYDRQRRQHKEKKAAAVKAETRAPKEEPLAYVPDVAQVVADKPGHKEKREAEPVFEEQAFEPEPVFEEHDFEPEQGYEPEYERDHGNGHDYQLENGYEQTTEAATPVAHHEERISPPIQPAGQKQSMDAPLDDVHERKSSESFVPPHFPRTGPFYTGNEPAASGVQPSNMTSAIRSQMISSTAAAPGAKAGLSKEVHGLKRKVLEKGTGSFTAGSMVAPQRSTTVPMKDNLNPPGKSKLSYNEPQGYHDHTGLKRPRDEKDAHQKKPERRREPKPGYCENCRDKFDDFEEHTLTRKHRRFAVNSTNWAELDSLLAEIQRPLKNQYEYHE
ncbi:hsk1-interacting molecule 1 [Penicillium brevicompactum]